MLVSVASNYYTVEASNTKHNHDCSTVLSNQYDHGMSKPLVFQPMNWSDDDSESASRPPYWHWADQWNSSRLCCWYPSQCTIPSSSGYGVGTKGPTSWVGSASPDSAWADDRLNSMLNIHLGRRWRIECDLFCRVVAHLSLLCCVSHIIGVNRVNVLKPQ